MTKKSATREEIAAELEPIDPLKFKDSKKYKDRLKESRAKTGRDDAVKAALAESALSVLRDAYPDSVASGRVDLSVQIVDMHRTSYRKIGMTDC